MDVKKIFLYKFLIFILYVKFNEKDGTIIFLHGLGSDSTLWENKLKKLFSVNERQKQNAIKIFCPKSPEMPITKFDENIMNSWFNVYDIYTSDNQGIRNAATVCIIFFFFAG
jgi:predicted esterase